MFLLDPDGLYFTPDPQLLSDRKKQKKSRKIHFHGIQEKKETGKKLKIVDSSLIVKNAYFLVERGFLTISSILHPINSLAACNH